MAENHLVSKAKDMSRKALERWWKDWENRDFSWEGLRKEKGFQSGVQEDLQTFLRRLENNVPDKTLVASGVLVDCGSKGLYHYVFVPQHWPSELDLDVSADDLKQKKSTFWSQIFNRQIRERSFGEIVGVEFFSDFGTSIISNTNLNFEFVRFAEHTNLHCMSDRALRNCLFSGGVKVLATHEDRKKAIGIERCVFLSGLEVTDTHEGVVFGCSKSHILGSVTLRSCNFDKFNFSGNRVYGFVRANRCEFRGEFSLRDCEQIESLDFVECDFYSFTHFNDLKISDSIELLSCKFQAHSIFASIQWPEPAQDSCRAVGSTFSEVCEIVGPLAPPIQFFSKVDFAKGASLSKISQKSWTNSFEHELTCNSAVSWSKFDKDQHIGSLEDGCRKLRSLFEREGNVFSEQFWHKNELISRRERDDCGFLEKSFSLIYQITSDFGLSIGRPFGTLMGGSLVFGLIYGWLGGSQWIGAFDADSAKEGLSFSLSRTFPLGLFGEATNQWRSDLLGDASSWPGLGKRALATFQTIFAAVFIFITAMSIRRKFKIG